MWWWPSLRPPNRFSFFFPVLSTESGFGILSTLRNLSKPFPCCHMRMFMVRPGVSLSHAVIQHSHFVGFLTAHTPNMYSTVQQGSLRLSSECCSCIWPAWVGSYWPFIIFYCRGSPIVSRIMGQGHVCVSSSDVLTTHQMTDMLELVTSEHLLKYSVKLTCWVAQHQAVMSFCKIQLQQFGGEQPPISNLYRLVSDSKPWAHFQLFKLYCSDKSNSDS